MDERYGKQNSVCVRIGCWEKQGVWDVMPPMLVDHAATLRAKSTPAPTVKNCLSAMISFITLSPAASGMRHRWESPCGPKPTLRSGVTMMPGRLSMTLRCPRRDAARWGCATICWCAGQEGQLPDAGVFDAGATRSAGDGRPEPPRACNPGHPLHQ
jgi:hypothetical protein